MRSRGILVFLTWGLTFVLMAGCAATLPTPSIDIASTGTFSPVATRTYTPVPTLTSTPTRTPTLTPTITPTPTIALPVREGTPFPEGVSLISPENAKRVVELSRWGEGVPQDIEWTPDGKWLVVATTQGIHVFSADTWDLLPYWLGKNEDVVSLAVCNHYVAGGVRYKGAIEVWDLQSGRLMQSFKSPFWTPHLACSSQGLIAAASGESVLLWDVNTGSQIKSFKIPAKRYGITALAFSPDGSMLATGSFWEHEVNILDARTGEFITRFKAAPAELAFSPNGKIIAIADLWDQNCLM